jgi:hypothetical protein
VKLKKPFSLLSILGALLLVLTASRVLSQPQPGYDELMSAVGSGQFSAEDCSELAESFGEWVVHQREVETRRNALLDSRHLGEDIHSGCRSAIRQLELATNEDEAALETLYRSELWYHMNRALASLRYWQAWLDLSLAQYPVDEAERVTELSRAERGFQASSLRILYPGLVYGSWLGLAYVAQLQDDETTMQQRLLRLKQALEPDPDNPLHEIIDTELGLLALSTGKVSPIAIVQGELLTPATARFAEKRAFMLLALRREENTGGFEAAELLRQLIDQGYLDDRLFARILGYRDEIVGFDIGNVGFLVEAEFAYSYQQYESSVLKFRQFLATDAVNLPLSLSPFTYHYAVALYQIGLHRDSMQIIQNLRAVSPLPPALLAPLTKLHFIVAEALYQDDPSTERAALVRSAAEEFIASAASDPDVASAHLALGRVVDDSGERARHLKLAAADSRLKGNVRAVELEVAVSQFQHTLANDGPVAAQQAAAAALELLESLPGSQQDTLAMQVLAVQLGSVLVETADDMLSEIDALSANPALDPIQKRVLVWSRLRLIDRVQGQGALRDYVRAFAGTGNTAFDYELYVLLREFESRGRSAELASLSGVWLSGLASTPQLQRQVWVLYITALRSSGQDQEALQAIHNMLAVFPNSGDAWEQLAEQSELMGDTFAAERALAHIAAAEPEGSPRWLDVSLHRLQLLVAADTPGTRSCTLEATIRVYNHRLQEEQQQIFAVLSRDMDCASQQE